MMAEGFKNSKIYTKQKLSFIERKFYFEKIIKLMSFSVNTDKIFENFH